MADTTEDKFKQAIAKISFIVHAKPREFYRKDGIYVPEIAEPIICTQVTDVLAVYAETQRRSVECLRQHKQQLQEVIEKLDEVSQNLEADGSAIQGWGYYQNTIEDIIRILKTFLSEGSSAKKVQGLEHG